MNKRTDMSALTEKVNYTPFIDIQTSVHVLVSKDMDHSPFPNWFRILASFILLQPNVENCQWQTHEVKINTDFTVTAVAICCVW